MNTVKRYNEPPGDHFGMEITPDGEYVSFEDYEAVLKQRDELLAALKGITHFGQELSAEGGIDGWREFAPLLRNSIAMLELIEAKAESASTEPKSIVNFRPLRPGMDVRKVGDEVLVNGSWAKVTGGFGCLIQTFGRFRRPLPEGWSLSECGEFLERDGDGKFLFTSSMERCPTYFWIPCGEYLRNEPSIKGTLYRLPVDKEGEL